LLSLDFLQFQKYGGKWVFVPNLQTMQQNTLVLKLFSEMFLFLKFDFNKIELCAKLNIPKIEFPCIYVSEI